MQPKRLATALALSVVVLPFPATTAWAVKNLESSQPKSVSICSDREPPTFPSKFKKAGVVAVYDFKLIADVTGNAELRMRSVVDAGFIFVPVHPGDHPFVRRIGGTMLHSQQQLDAEFAKMCRFEENDLTLVELWFASPDQGRRLRETDKRHRQQQKNTERRMKQFFADFYPDQQELDILLRSKWAEYDGLFGLDETQFGKVRDIRCRRENRRFLCHIGVTATSNNGPEYEQANIEFTRDDNGALLLIESEPEPIIVT